jgi:hypothetical protein
MYATIQEQVEILAKSNVSSKQAMNEEAAEAAKEKVSFLMAHVCMMYLINFLTPVSSNTLIIQCIMNNLKVDHLGDA